MRRQNRREDEESDINLTPMLDVTFIMLIFFIVTSSFVKEAGIEVNKPAAATAERKERGSVPGSRGAYVLQEPNGDVWVMAIFDSEELYRKNAADPAQDRWYRQLREMLEADPEWHDGEITEEPA